MIEVVEIDSWSLFEERMQQLLSRQREPLTPLSLFRGHSDANWRLETTLERVLGLNVSIEAYYSMIKTVRAEIETFTNSKWDLPDLHDFSSLWLDKENSLGDYLGYLRHHGFPSPLLDWTMSPFIAAYFAFRDLASKAKSVAIYHYWQSWDGPLGNPKVSILRGNYRNNKRYYLQQSVYTLCTRSKAGQEYFSNHEDSFSRKTEESDYLTKYILPASERTSALLSLESYNINPYSLMGSEESLLETVFFRYYGLRKAWKDEYPNWDGNDW